MNRALARVCIVATCSTEAAVGSSPGTDSPAEEVVQLTTELKFNIEVDEKSEQQRLSDSEHEHEYELTQLVGTRLTCQMDEHVRGQAVDAVAIDLHKATQDSGTRLKGKVSMQWPLTCAPAISPSMLRTTMPFHLFAADAVETLQPWPVDVVDIDAVPPAAADAVDIDFEAVQKPLPAKAMQYLGDLAEATGFERGVTVAALGYLYLIGFDKDRSWACGGQTVLLPGGLTATPL